METTEQLFAEIQDITAQYIEKTKQAEALVDFAGGEEPTEEQLGQHMQLILEAERLQTEGQELISQLNNRLRNGIEIN